MSANALGIPNVRPSSIHLSHDGIKAYRVAPVVGQQPDTETRIPPYSARVSKVQSWTGSLGFVRPFQPSSRISIHRMTKVVVA
ncbi:hypothetical protein LTR66_001635 [Elasticomyces elasticus]|nr:hypothetical protein LTR66_001635 [Elasticomyces elasticus]